MTFSEMHKANDIARQQQLMGRRTAPLYRAIASTLQAYQYCIETTNTEWEANHHATLERLAHELPSGSGIDCGTSIDIKHSTSNHLVLHTSYHHMDEGGGYDRWTNHVVHVTPSLVFGIDICITGKNRNDIKECLYQTFQCALTEEVEY